MNIYNSLLRFVPKVILILPVPSHHNFTPGRIPIRDLALVAVANLRVELDRIRHLGNIQATLREKKKDVMSKSALLLGAWSVHIG